MRCFPEPFSNHELIANDMFGEAGNETKRVNGIKCTLGPVRYKILIYKSKLDFAFCNGTPMFRL